MVDKERGGGFDKDAFDSLLKQLLEPKEPSVEQSAEQPSPASKAPRKDVASPTTEPPPPPVQEREGVIAPPSAPPAVPAERAHPEMEDLKKRLAELEATQSRLQEQLAAATQQKESAPPATEPPSAAATEAAPLDEPEAGDQPVAAERALVKVPEAGELSTSGQGLLERLLDLLRRLFPSFVPARGASMPPDNPDALYTGRIELVIPAEDAWGRLERILTGLAGLRGAQVHGLYSGPRGEQNVSLELDVPASLKDIQEAVPELKEIRTLSSQKGVTRLAVKIT